MSHDLQPISLSTEQWQRVRVAFARDGVTVPDEASGEIDKSGVEASFTYDGKTLRVTIQKAPIFMEQIAANKVRDFIDNAIAQA